MGLILLPALYYTSFKTPSAQFPNPPAQHLCGRGPRTGGSVRSPSLSVQWWALTSQQMFHYVDELSGFEIWEKMVWSAFPSVNKCHVLSFIDLLKVFSSLEEWKKINWSYWLSLEMFRTTAACGHSTSTLRRTWAGGGFMSPRAMRLTSVLGLVPICGAPTPSIPRYWVRGGIEN